MATAKNSDQKARRSPAKPANINAGAPRLPHYDNLAAASARIGRLSTIAALETVRKAADHDANEIDQKCFTADQPARAALDLARWQRWDAEERLREAILVSRPTQPSDVVVILDMLFDAHERLLSQADDKSARKAEMTEVECSRLLVATENLLAFVPGLLGIATDNPGEYLARERVARRYEVGAA